MVNRIVPPSERGEFLKRIRNLKPYRLSKGDLSVFYRIADGTLSPLEGPMGEGEFYRVLEEESIEREGERLAWTIPLAFPIAEQEARRLRVGEELAVISPGGELVGSLQVEEIYLFDKERYRGNIRDNEEGSSWCEDGSQG